MRGFYLACSFCVAVLSITIFSYFQDVRLVTTIAFYKQDTNRDTTLKSTSRASTASSTTASSLEKLPEAPTTSRPDGIIDTSYMSSSVGSRTLASFSKSASQAVSATMKITPRRSGARGHAHHGWLNTYHTFSFADYFDPKHMSFGSIRVLNEDRVSARNGFPTHPHRDAEIFSYILSGELTHRDSMVSAAGGAGSEVAAGKDKFFRMRRGDVQFTTGGTGIAHSEQNESDEEVHFLQIWALPWARRLAPVYHTLSFPDEGKRAAFLPILSPLAAGKGASAAEEKAATPRIAGTIPIHADLVMAAGLVGAGKSFEWRVGGGQDGAVTKTADRRLYVHVPMTKGGETKIKLTGNGKLAEVLGEGDGAYIEGANVGDVIGVESVGTVEAEVVLLDSD